MDVEKLIYALGLMLVFPMTIQSVWSLKASMNNKKIGSEFEQKLCQYFADFGYWVHFINPAPDGSQPFDIIAVKGIQHGHSISEHVVAVDCKTLSDREKRFPLNRMEDNQISAFTLLNSKGIHNTYFAIQHRGKVYLLPSQHLIEKYQRGEKSILIENYYERVIHCE